MPQALGFKPKLAISRPNWLFARSFGVANRTGMLVYRSLWLDEADEWLDEVWSTVKKQRLGLAWKGKFLDVDMTFSQGELSLYLSPADGQSYGLELSPETLAEVRAAADKVWNRETKQDLSCTA